MAGEPGRLLRAWGVPPFSVFEPRQEYWKNRKRWWISLGIKSEEGRRGDLLFKNQARLDEIQAGKTGGGPAYIDGYRIKEGKKKIRKGGVDNKAMGSKPVFRFGYDYDKSTVASQEELYRLGTSIFDPVLCEMYYRWFCPPAGHIFDPFAGGSVRGAVAAAMERKYTGIELRGEQVESNRAQWKDLVVRHPGVFAGKPEPTWLQGDSNNCREIALGEYDAIFSCPPYFDLEVYCDDPLDLSNKSWEEFAAGYTRIVAAAASMLKPNRFATYVVTELRDEKGLYRRFPELTVEAFAAAGLAYYNEAVLVTAVGSLPIRVGNQFRASRKLGRTHQNILTFIKGNPALAAKACSEAEEEIASRPGSQKAVQGDLFGEQEGKEPEPEAEPVVHSEGSGAVPGSQGAMFGAEGDDGAIAELKSADELEGGEDQPPPMEQAEPGGPPTGSPAAPEEGKEGEARAPEADRQGAGAGEAEGELPAPPSAEPAPVAAPPVEEWF